MTSEELKRWRIDLAITQRKAADALGMTLAKYQQLERGANFETGKPTRIDLRTSYACAAIRLGIAPEGTNHIVNGADNGKTIEPSI